MIKFDFQACPPRMKKKEETCEPDRPENRATHTLTCSMIGLDRLYHQTKIIKHFFLSNFFSNFLSIFFSEWIRMRPNRSEQIESWNKFAKTHVFENMFWKKPFSVRQASQCKVELPSFKMTDQKFHNYHLIDIVSMNWVFRTLSSYHMKINERHHNKDYQW